MLGKFVSEVRNFFRKGDIVLLVLCLVTSAFGCLMIASTTNYRDTMSYVYTQIAAIGMGVVVYIAISSLDIDFFSEHRMWLVVINTVLILLLLSPYGTDFESGNKSWLVFPFLPVAIQPAEICKITFVLILASVMASHQNRVSSFWSVMHMVFHLAMVAGLNLVISSDMGVSMIFVFIFAGMALTGGVRWFWFAIAGGMMAVGGPVVWNYVFSDRQRNRFLIIFDPTIDPLGMVERYHTLRSQLSLNGGGLLGQGLFNGNRTQTGALFAQHTDFIFSAIGEELGFMGCLLVIVMLLAIIIRCVYVGSKSPDYMRKVLCYGVASALIFQTLVNVGMCIGVVPIIGLTLPFISYGGSSILSLYAMVGFVSGVHARPERDSYERYIHPPLTKAV